MKEQRVAWSPSVGVLSGTRKGDHMTTRPFIGVLAAIVFLLAFSVATRAQRAPNSAHTASLATVNVGTMPVALAVNTATQKIYVANRESNNITVIEGTTNSTTTVATGRGPAAVAINPATNKIYVANMFGNTVTVINAADNSTLTVPVGDSPRTVVVNPFANKIYVINEKSNSVTVIDGTSNAVLTTVPVGASPRYAAVNPVTNRIYVPGTDVRVIDGTDNSTTTIGVPSGEQVAINPVTNTVFVIGSIFLTWINGVNNSAETFFFGAPVAIAVNAVTNRTYVVDIYGAIGIVEGASNNVNFVDLRNPAPAIAVNSSTNRVYVPITSHMAPGVAILNGSGSQLGFVPTPARPEAAALDSARNTLYVASPTGNVVYVVEDEGLARDAVEVTGRVISANGAPVSRAVLSMLDTDGRFRTAITNPFGYYRFTDVPVGTSIVEVRSKRHRFTHARRALNLSTTTNEAINFVADN